MPLYQPVSSATALPDGIVAFADLASGTPDALAADPAFTGTYVRPSQVVDSTYGDGATDATAHIQAKLTAAGASGTLFIPQGVYVVSSALTVPAGCEVVGFGIKATVIRASADIEVFTGTGEGISIRNLKVQNTYAAGARTHYDLDFYDMTKLTLERVEIALPGNNTGAGGIHLHRVSSVLDDGTCSMTYMRDVWIRNGSMLIDGVSDSKIHGGWTWSNGTGAAGAIEMRESSNWTIVDHDVVPSVNAGYLISAQLSKLTIIGGMVDGSYAAIHTGWGIKATATIRALTVSAVKFWNCWLGGIWLNDARRCNIVGNIFSELNRGDNSYPDIKFESSTANVIQGNTFCAPFERTNKGLVFVEDSSCSENVFIGNVVEVNSAIVPDGHYYDPAMIDDRPSTLVKDNRPEAAWPQGSVPAALIPTRLAQLATISATAWPAANTAIFQRLSVPEAGVYRYLNMQLDGQSGNYQVGVVKLSGSGLTDYTRVMDSGVVATPAASGSGLRVSLGATKLDAGEYAAFVWFDNTTATTRYATNSGVPATRCAASVAGLTTGVPASGTLAWTGSQILGSLSIERDI